jgi:hypothetical protein
VQAENIPHPIENLADQGTTVGTGLPLMFNADGCHLTQVFRQDMIAIYARAYLKQPRPKLSTEERDQTRAGRKIIEEMFRPPREVNPRARTPMGKSARSRPPGFQHLASDLRVAGCTLT